MAPTDLGRLGDGLDCHRWGGFCICFLEEPMPMYKSRCRACGKRFETLRRMQDADRDLECRSEEVERLISTFAAGGCSASGRFT
jgi:putative FmdB family regulatory protein